MLLIECGCGWCDDTLYRHCDWHGSYEFIAACIVSLCLRRLSDGCPTYGIDCYERCVQRGEE